MRTSCARCTRPTCASGSRQPAMKSSPTRRSSSRRTCRRNPGGWPASSRRRASRPIRDPASAASVIRTIHGALLTMTRDDPDLAPRRALPSAAAIVERIVVGVVALALVLLGFFFLAAALVAGAVLAAVFLARIWWLRRRIKREEESGYLTTEYEVVDREPPRDPRPPPGA